MSFSTDVKKELCEETVHASHCRMAELAAILSVAGEVRYQEKSRILIIKTENISCCRKFIRLFRQVFQVTLPEPSDSLSKETGVYRMEIRDDELIHRIFLTLKLEESGGRLFVDNILVERACCKRGFLRGIFLAAGSVNNPEKAYHMEIVLDNEEKAKQLQSLYESFEIDAKYMVRKKYHVVYIKEGDAIVDVLNIMGAHVSLMKLENIRIVKDIRNSINRQVNCDTANMNKTANAAVRQMEDIAFIERTKGLDYLPEHLRQIALLRKEEPELNLKDLGMLLEPPLGKSGVNHRLRKISEIAENLRQKSMTE